MNTIDFSHDGGYPLTQDELNYLQQAYIECISALANIVPNSTPVTISGMTSSFFFGITSIAPGYFIYNGVIYHFTGGSFGALSFGGGTVPLVEITDNTTNLTYNDGSSFPAHNSQTASLILAATVTDATHFPLSALATYPVALGLSGRESTFTSVTFSTGPGAGTITTSVYYKKNYITNTLQMYGLVWAQTPQDFVTPPNVSTILVATLPAGYRPATSPAHFPALGNDLFPNSAGGYFSHINGHLDTTGKLTFDFIQQSFGSETVVEFNCIIPLD